MACVYPSDVADEDSGDVAVLDPFDATDGMHPMWLMWIKVTCLKLILYDIIHVDPADLNSSDMIDVNQGDEADMDSCCSVDGVAEAILDDLTDVSADDVAYLALVL